MRALKPFMPVIIFLNWFGAFIGGIWAALTGDWWAVWYTVIGFFVSEWIIGILLVPSAGMGVAAMAAFNRRHLLTGRVLSGAGSLYVAAVMAGWALLMTLVFLGHERHFPILPMLLLAYSATTSPWMSLAQKEMNGGSDLSSGLATIMLQAGYLLGGTLMLLNSENGIGTVLGTVVLTLLIGWVLQQRIVGALLREAVVTEPTNEELLRLTNDELALLKDIADDRVAFADRDRARALNARLFKPKG